MSGVYAIADALHLFWILGADVLGVSMRIMKVPAMSVDFECIESNRDDKPLSSLAWPLGSDGGIHHHPDHADLGWGVHPFRSIS